ncbi:hypothetical protein BDP27DRAFT_1423075 [Rhodocollybia butyracea]|uniref:Fruit-body specific protein a n=1 Tax=Rhodocollybia butyracea TaxID=206335 RepID=A0A9P5PSA1_9AGAR|nr:hypothetical protein BDP27DRAFT_1423075 [Rhodocollybia butyracea]
MRSQICDKSAFLVEYKFLIASSRLCSSTTPQVPMLSFARFLVFSTLAISVAECGLVFPAFQGIPASGADPYDFNGTTTNSNVIVSTAKQVNQKSGATTDAAPDLPVLNTTITAIDGEVVNATVPLSRRSLSADAKSKLSRRNNSNYEMVFWGTGTESEDRDASIEGTFYLTYSLVDNSTYSIDQCLDYCDSIPECVFVNLYYEFNNELLDHIFSQHSNLKCVAYGDVHSAQEKTNFGGQSLSGNPNGPLTYIQQSSGWSSKALCDPSPPDGYDPVGDLDGANEAPGYMGFVFLDQYDVNACAATCNNRDPDPVGGSCKYFNIWRAVVDGVPTTYTCSMYYIPAPASTATNFGQGDLAVTWSRGYSRKTLVIDGGFEGYTCDDLPSDFCLTTATSTWNGSSPDGGYYDATIFHFGQYAHSGLSVALLGSAYGSDDLPGTLTYTSAFATSLGVTYTVEFFHSSVYSGEDGEVNAFVEVFWNGQLVGTIHPGYSEWTYYKFLVIAQGNEGVLKFTGGAAPSYDFIDDVYVMQA